MADINILVANVLRWAYARRIIQESTVKDQYLKAVSEMGELADSILKGDRDGAVDGIGDVLVCLINASEIMGISINEALQHAYDEIKDRKGVMHNGCFIKKTDPRYNAIIKKM